MAKFIMIVTGLSGALSVILGAFASHGLKKKISPEMVVVFKTGVDYQFYHTFAMAIVGLSMLNNAVSTQLLNWAFISFITGIIFFSGSLYLLALTRKKIFGPITPIGGLFFIAGWGLLTVHWLNV